MGQLALPYTVCHEVMEVRVGRRDSASRDPSVEAEAKKEPWCVQNSRLMAVKCRVLETWLCTD